MVKLHVFDMDGTLLRGASVEEISRHLGCFEQATQLEQAYLEGRIVDDPGFWDDVLALWDHASDSDLDDAFDRSPWMDRVADVFADITARGEHSVVISQSPSFVVRRLERWGAEATYGTTVDFGLKSHVDHLLTEQDKLDITLRLLTELGLGTEDCVAYGDSTSDVVLFDVLENTVAVNAMPFIRDVAARTYTGTDMWEAYRVGRELVS